MVARLLTGLSLLLSAAGAGSVVRAVWREFVWLEWSPLLSLISATLDLAHLGPPLVVAALAWACRRERFAALAVVATAIPVSALTVCAWAVATASGPDAYETLAIFRALVLGLVTLVLLAGCIAVGYCRTGRRAGADGARGR